MIFRAKLNLGNVDDEISEPGVISSLFLDSITDRFTERFEGKCAKLKHW